MKKYIVPLVKKRYVVPITKVSCVNMFDIDVEFEKENEQYLCYISNL